MKGKALPRQRSLPSQRNRQMSLLLKRKILYRCSGLRILKAAGGCQTDARASALRDKDSSLASAPREARDKNPRASALQGPLRGRGRREPSRTASVPQARASVLEEMCRASVLQVCLRASVPREASRDRERQSRGKGPHRGPQYQARRPGQASPMGRGSIAANLQEMGREPRARGSAAVTVDRGRQAARSGILAGARSGIMAAREAEMRQASGPEASPHVQENAVTAGEMTGMQSPRLL